MFSNSSPNKISICQTSHYIVLEAKKLPVNILPSDKSKLRSFLYSPKKSHQDHIQLFSGIASNRTCLKQTKHLQMLSECFFINRNSHSDETISYIELTTLQSLSRLPSKLRTHTAQVHTRSSTYYILWFAIKIKGTTPEKKCESVANNTEKSDCQRCRDVVMAKLWKDNDVPYKRSNVSYNFTLESVTGVRNSIPCDNNI